jgi:spore coat polysaccharide biosynthesis protein SpsF (cytidylyltransferase family)
MVCTPCQQKRDKLLQEARTKKTSIFFKGNADPVQIKIHGRIPHSSANAAKIKSV